MEKLSWDQSLSVGVAEIDREHKQIIEILNLLISDPEANTQSESISETLNMLMQYAQAHFKTEVDLMKKHGYPGLAVHREAHTAFMEKLVAFCLGAMEQQETIPTELVQYITGWLDEHILQEDMKYVSFFKKHGVN